MKRVRMATALGIIIATASVWSATPAGADPPGRQPGGAQGLGAFPAGVACPFAVSFDLVAGGEGQLFTFVDHGGDLVRLMNTARPATWVVTNLDTGATYTFTGQGGVTRITPSADGTTTVVASGGIIGFNSPTDTPPGPFALSIEGHLIFVIAPDGTGTLTQVSGKITDLCAAVS
jgi:hypothetical protein